MRKAENHDAGTGGRPGDVPKGRPLSGVLGHPVRRSVLRRLLFGRGADLDDLARETGLSVKQVRYHLGVLREHGLVDGTGNPRRQEEPGRFAAACRELAEVARRRAESRADAGQAPREPGQADRRNQSLPENLRGPRR